MPFSRPYRFLSIAIRGPRIRKVRLSARAAPRCGFSPAVPEPAGTALIAGETQAMIATGTDIAVKGPKEFAALLGVEFDKWGKVVREVKLQIN